MLNDPEVAAHIAAQPEPTGPGRPDWVDYTPERAALDNILDRLGEVVAAVYAAQGGKPPRIPAVPRPMTEVHRVKARLERQHHDDLVAEVKAAQERWAQSREG